MKPLNFAEAICMRFSEATESFFVIVNDRTTCDITPSGHATNIQDEECAVIAATPSAGLHLKRMKDGQEISFQWHAVGSIRIIDQ